MTLEEYGKRKHRDAVQSEICGKVESIIFGLINREADLLGDSSKVFIGGFSQGGVMALATFALFKQG